MRCFFVDRDCLFVLHVSLMVYEIYANARTWKDARGISEFSDVTERKRFCVKMSYVICVIVKIREYCMQFLILIGPQTKQTMTCMHITRGVLFKVTGPARPAEP